ncbi:DUF2391 family protein [Candidatus Woesearchaeota archaeon]|nr:DUF2391 family protein [Candidatus Woesearchaeota archaeon]
MPLYSKKEGEKPRLIYRWIHHPEFQFKDLLQILIGASILAIPVGFTEETWELGASLPFINVLFLLIVSVLFVSAFTYYHYYAEQGLQKHFSEFIKRIISTYIASFIVVAVLLTIIQRTPWTTDFILALKRTIIVTFPSSMSAVVADILK